MENIVIYMGLSSSKHFNYAFDFLQLVFRKKHIRLYKKYIHNLWDVKNKEKQIIKMIKINRYK